MMKAPDIRDELVSFVYRDLVGPAHGREERLTDQPRIRYAAGVLFPQEAMRDESVAYGGLEESENGGTSSVDTDEIGGTEDNDSGETADSNRSNAVELETDHDDTVTLANSFRPAAMGLSVAVVEECTELLVQVSAATYQSMQEQDEGGETKRTVWQRRELELEPARVSLASGSVDHELYPGLNLRVLARRRSSEVLLVTASVYNTTIENSKEAETFYQVGFSIYASNRKAVFCEYDKVSEGPADYEELALEMMYRERRVFGVGHGCAATWDGVTEGRTDYVSTDIVPSVVVPPIVPFGDNSSYFDMSFLQGDCENPKEQIPEALEAFCQTYEDWIETKRNDAKVMEEKYRAVAKRHLDVCASALSRMRNGVELLRNNDDAIEAFMLTNRAMLMQQYHSRRRRRLGDPWEPLPREYLSNWNNKQGFWRAFQIGFILLNIAGVESAESVANVNGTNVYERDLVDLIWFPTGGGKTEAYFGLAAFSIFLSRMRDPSRNGCRILMRYTLRLLTSQQFQRAASLICACEIIRREDPERFGKTPISIGLWVGMSLTPNDEPDALRKLTEMDKRPTEAKNPFQLLSCPWCGTELSNSERYGYVEHEKHQIFLCPADGSDGNEPCPFSAHGRQLPVCVIDETIYRDPPTLIVGTVDKFAMLAWRPQAGSILTRGGGPELIIQDELHLISGPLGSMVGLYESSIDYLCGASGARPKIVASTATIRRAEQQCRALYDRSMFQFPPPGVEISDSFFAREDREANGRRYVGFLPTASSSPLTAQIRSVVALQQGVKIVPDAETRDSEIDPYWTLVQYFGSLKELGRAATFITADIPEYLPTMHRRYELEQGKKRWMVSEEELTSRKSEDEIPKILKKLETNYNSNADRDEQALDTVLATNMISVGMDVDRLGLMMVVTQPKGTSEYIQATSRVGRKEDKPGLILTLYNAGRPRDRSHYEHFRAYHEAFYRFVEPTSVTPFAPPAMARALHAILIIGGRHVAGWNSPREFDPEDVRFASFVDFLRSRVASVDPEHLKEFEDTLAVCLEEWDERRPERWGSLFPAPDDDPALMRVAGTAARDEDRYTWETPTSMRNVDVECAGEVIARYR